MSESLINLWINSETNSLLPSWNSFGSSVMPSIKQGDSVSFEVHWIKSDLSGQYMKEVVFHPDSQLKMAFGIIDGSPTEGSFTYTFEGDSVVIPYDATSSSANTLINSLPSIVSAGGVVVTLVNKRTLRIVFNNNGARALPSCDGSALRPSTGISITRVNAGTASSKEVHYIKQKLSPVAFSDNFVASPSPTISISTIDSITKRISISPNPKFGSFAISNGTLTTNSLSIDSTEGEITDSLVSSGISNTNRVYSVSKSGDYSWDIYRISGTAETLSVTNSGMIGFNSRIGVVNFNTAEIEDLLAGEPSVSVVMEVEYTYGGSKQTIYQGSATIVNDLIDSAGYSPVALSEPIYEAPIDSQQYVRKDGGWSILDIDGGTY